MVRLNFYSARCSNKTSSAMARRRVQRATTLFNGEPWNAVDDSVEGRTVTGAMNPAIFGLHLFVSK